MKYCELVLEHKVVLRASCERWASPSKQLTLCVPQIHLRTWEYYCRLPAAVWAAQAFGDWTCTCNEGLVVSILAEPERAVAVICGSWPPLVVTWWAKASLPSPLFVLQPDIGALQVHNHHYIIQKCLSSDLWVMKEGDNDNSSNKQSPVAK